MVGPPAIVDESLHTSRCWERRFFYYFFLNPSKKKLRKSDNVLYNASALVKQECNESRDVFWQRALPLPGSWHLKDNRFHVAVMHRCNAIKELISDQEIQAPFKNGSCHTCLGKSAKLANGGRSLQSGKNKVVPVTQNRLPVSVGPEGLVSFFLVLCYKKG